MLFLIKETTWAYLEVGISKLMKVEEKTKSMS